MPYVEVMNMKKCGVCGDVLPDENLDGDICFDCSDRYDEYGVLFCLE